MITENLVSKAGTLTAITAAIGTNEVSHLVTSAETTIELTLVLWMIGGLLSIIALLLAAVCYFIQDMRRSNGTEHASLISKTTLLNDRVVKLEAEHSTAFALKGCAYEPVRLREEVAAVVESILDHESKQI